MLNGVKQEALWDTGAQVSILSEAFLKGQLGGESVRPIAELINEKLDLTAANGSSIPYTG